MSGHLILIFVIQSYTVTDLSVYTQYLLSIRVTNPEGEGPETIVVVMTDEGAPSSPRNVKILAVEATSIKLSWWEPARPNGVIQGYRIYFQQNNLTSVQEVARNHSAITDTLTILSKSTLTSHPAQPSLPHEVLASSQNLHPTLFVVSNPPWRLEF